MCSLCRLLSIFCCLFGCVGNGIIGISRCFNPVTDDELRTSRFVGLTAQYLILVGTAVRRISGINPYIAQLIRWCRLCAEHLHLAICGLLCLACIGKGFGDVGICNDSPLIGVAILGKAVCLARLVVVIQVSKVGIFILICPTAGRGISQGRLTLIEPRLNSPIHLILKVGYHLRVLDEIVYLLLGQALC